MNEPRDSTQAERPDRSRMKNQNLENYERFEASLAPGSHPVSATTDFGKLTSWAVSSRPQGT